MHDQTIPQRIRKYRERQQITGSQLASMADISPSYLSLIENGLKLPSAEVAERIARALGDDPDIYRAWVETADDKDLDARADRLEKFRQMRSTPGSVLHRRGRSRVLGWLAGQGRSKRVAEDSEPEGRPLALAAEPPVFDLLSANLDESSIPKEADRGRTLNVPLLREGTDFARVRRSPRPAEETIAVDRQLLGDDQDPQDLFAYRVTERSIDRVTKLVLPGDVLVFAADPESVDPTAIYAVRLDRKIVLSRIVYSEPTLLLVASDPYQEPIQVDIGSEDALFHALAGVVVTGIRTWPKQKALEPRVQTPSLGRTGRFEDGSIVRDCEWKDNYGWRPVQRAEDLDYLDAHPGTTVRFPLIRDGKVKYVLEMDADQWREALKDHYVSPSWPRNGYIVAITKRVKGEYTEEFQDR